MSNTCNFFKKKKKWSKMKDNVLATYLKPYLSKITKTRKDIIIVDCFAGKGKFDDGEMGSPLIINNSIRNIMEKNKSFSKVQYESLLIELKYAKELEHNVLPFKFATVYSGDFENCAEEIKRYSKNKNLFAYIDPFGIKNLKFETLKFLNRTNYYTVEMLMNFNSYGFLREGCRILKYKEFNEEEYNDEDCENEHYSKTYLDEIAEDVDWRDILNKYNENLLDMKAVEEIFVSKLIYKYKTLFKYVINIPVKVKAANIPKYRLFFGSNSADGIILMNDNMRREWKKFLSNDRCNMDTNDNQISLFQPSFKNSEIVRNEYLSELEYPNHSIGKEYNPSKDINDILNSRESIGLKELYVELIMKNGITYSTSSYREIIKDYEKIGKFIVKRYNKENVEIKSNSYSDNKLKIIISKVG